MKCPTCESCEYEQYCGATEIMRKCERHNKKVEQTNEEYIRSCSKEELTKVIFDLTNEDYLWTEEEALAWLKEKHNA